MLIDLTSWNKVYNTMEPNPMLYDMKGGARVMHIQ